MQNFENNFFPELMMSDSSNNNLQVPNSANDITHSSNKKSSSVHYFAIDSRQRDYDLYPEANNYYVPIPDSYNNVTSIELKAAMLPRSEYNVNSSNKYIDFCIGDFISKVKVKSSNSLKVLKDGKKVSPGTYNLSISGKLTNAPYNPAIVTIDVDNSSYIVPSSIKIVYAGSGYISSKKIKSYLFDFEAFDIEIGIKYTAKMREGQYTIGGNPIMYDNVNNKYVQSWTPSKLLNEIEACMSNVILEDSEHCYSRIAWSSRDSSTGYNSTKDYPLLFNARIMSQYPVIDTYSSLNNPSNRSEPEEFEANSCKFNRMYISNCLIFQIENLDDINTLGGEFIDDGGNTYIILKSIMISEQNSNRYILFCKLKDNYRQWKGFGEINNLKSLISSKIKIRIANFELLFATGEYNVVNSASLLGFNKRNYFKSTKIDKIQINDNKCLIPRCICYSSENDYFLYGDPEYIILSFRPKHGTNTIKQINNRVDSIENSNINRVFACLIFDPIQPSVLQDLSSGTAMGTINSFANTANNTKSFLVNNNEPNLNDNLLLCGNVGTFNSIDFKQPGMIRAMKGYDFDQKIIKFPQPMSSLSHLNIRFTKFSKSNIGTDEELYNFHGKEHFLLFEIKCEDQMTGNHQ